MDSLLKFQGKEILQGFGTISNKAMENIVREKYEKFNEKRKKKYKHKKPMKTI